MSNPDSVGLKPLDYKFEFERDPKEHVDAMYAVTAWVQENRGTKWNVSFNMFAWAGIFIVLLATMQLLTYFGYDDVIVVSFMVGAIATIAALSVWTVFGENKVKDFFIKELNRGLRTTVKINGSGIRSTTGGLDLMTPWADVRSAELKPDQIFIVEELVAHYLPKRAVPDTLTLAHIFEEIEIELPQGTKVKK